MVSTKENILITAFHLFAKDGYDVLEDDFVSSFRKVLTLEQFRNEEMQALYQQYLAQGTMEYVRDLFESMGL